MNTRIQYFTNLLPRDYASYEADKGDGFSMHPGVCNPLSPSDISGSCHHGKTDTGCLLR